MADRDTTTHLVTTGIIGKYNVTAGQSKAHVRSPWRIDSGGFAKIPIQTFGVAANHRHRRSMLEDEGEVQEMNDDQRRWLKELQDIRWDHHEKIYLRNIHNAKHAQLWYELETYFFIPVDSEKNPTKDAAEDGTGELLRKLVKQGWKAD